MRINRPNKIIVHHTSGSDSNPLSDSSNFTFQDCEALHKKRFHFLSALGYWTGYQYFIEKDGKVFQARSDIEEGAHTVGQNTTSIGICLAGNFDVTLPTKAQEDSLTLLMTRLMSEHLIMRSQIYPHRKFASKTCYGRKLSDTWARDLISEDTYKLLLMQLIDKLKSLLRPK